MASYANRIQRYLDKHPGASIAEARGHGRTPERPGQGVTSERFAGYYGRRAELIRHIADLKGQKFQGKGRWNPENPGGVAGMPMAYLERWEDYDNIADYIEDYPDDDEADKYH